jgi:hypothetical protein
LDVYGALDFDESANDLLFSDCLALNSAALSGISQPDFDIFFKRAVGDLNNQTSGV